MLDACTLAVFGLMCRLGAPFCRVGAPRRSSRSTAAARPVSPYAAGALAGGGACAGGGRGLQRDAGPPGQRADLGQQRHVAVSGGRGGPQRGGLPQWAGGPASSCAWACRRLA